MPKSINACINACDGGMFLSTSATSACTTIGMPASRIDNYLKTVK
ncbi:MAG: hypothetical protein ACLUVZ_15975 [Bacteroides stercoris]